MKYHTVFFSKLGKISQNLSSAAVVIGALRVSDVFQTLEIFYLSGSKDPVDLIYIRVFTVYKSTR